MSLLIVGAGTYCTWERHGGRCKDEVRTEKRDDYMATGTAWANWLLHGI